MTTISQNAVGVNFKSAEPIQTQKSQAVDAKPKTEDKGISNAMKAGIGVGALAVVALAGMAIRGKIKSNQVKQLNELKGSAERIENVIRDTLAHQDEKTKALFNPELMEGHIEDAKKLPLKEQVKELKKIKRYSNFDYSYFDEPLAGRKIIFEWQRPPKPSKEILDTKDQYLIADEYYKLRQNRLFDSKTQGKTIQETVENVFGKGTEIKPHTYDLSKEADLIGTQETIGGYKPFVANKDGKYHFVMNGSDKKYQWSGYSDNRFSIRSDVLEQQGYGIAVQKSEGKPVVFMDVYDENIKTSNRSMYLFSPNSEMTPMQKDLLSLNGKLTPEDINVYKDIFGKGNNRNIDNPLALSGDRNYDGIASFVQSMAEKYRH